MNVSFNITIIIINIIKTHFEFLCKRTGHVHLMKLKGAKLLNFFFITDISIPQSTGIQWAPWLLILMYYTLKPKQKSTNWQLCIVLIILFNLSVVNYIYFIEPEAEYVFFLRLNV